MEKPLQRDPRFNKPQIVSPSDDISIRCFCPAPDLRFFVKFYWIVKVQDAKKITKRSKISPSGYPELIFHFGDIVSVCSPGERAPDVSTDSLIAGQLTQSVHLHFHNHVNSLCVKLQPYTLKTLFRTKSSEFTNRATSLNDIYPKMQKEVYEQLSEAINDKMRIGIIENHLRKLLQKNNNGIHPVTCAAINHLKDNINRNFGRPEQIMGVSSSTMQRRMMEDIGISPKMLKRIFRFNIAYHLIKHNKNLDLQDVAFYLCYYDLSHLINEFKEFTGSSPVKYFKKEDVYNGLFAGIL
ncbi:MAG TPA: AraC family transcriptional regulator [Bacteroidetes bacterium]|nr:AraC family transcriptional regulator [Bacteroidota bacterium]